MTYTTIREGATVILAGLWPSAGSALLAQPQYAITDLGGAGELGLTLGHGVNDHAQVGGEISPLLGGENPVGETHAFLLTPIEVVCDGDANDDGTVDPLDSGFVMARFGCAVGTGDPNCDTADMNGDAQVDPLDVGFILARFGSCE
ncbi:MAG: hypothetical protein IH988_05415 [Planctomycetes bacterium]|nr:hypothetical protein [Planctomycetota bacterium]